MNKSETDPLAVLPEEIATCLLQRPTNATQAKVLAWLSSHQHDTHFWAQFPEQTATDSYRWAAQAESKTMFWGGPLWVLMNLGLAGWAGYEVVTRIDLGEFWTIGLGLLAVMSVLLGGCAFVFGALARPWARLWNCEHVASIQSIVGGCSDEFLEDVTIEVEGSPAAMKYLNEVGKHRKLIAQDVHIARHLAPGYVPLVDA